MVDVVTGDMNPIEIYCSVTKAVHLTADTVLECKLYVGERRGRVTTKVSSFTGLCACRPKCELEPPHFVNIKNKNKMRRNEMKVKVECTAVG